MALATLSIDLQASTAGLQAGMDKAGRLAQKNAAEIEARYAKLQDIGKQLGLAIGAAFVGAASGTAVLVKSAIDTSDAMIKQARSVGLTVEAYSALTYAGELAGVSQDELAASLTRLARTAKDAGDGVKESAQAFDALGIKVLDNEGRLKSTDRLLDEVAEKFAGMAAGTEKTARATDLFGKSGARLITLLDSGAGGLDKMRAEAKALGLVMSTETAQAAEQFNDNLARLGKLTTGIGNDLARQLLPVLVDVTNAVVDFGKESRAAGAGAEGLGGAASALTNTFQALVVLGANVSFVLQATGRELGAWAAQFVAAMDLLNTSPREGVEGIKSAWRRFTAISDAVTADAARARAELDAFERRVLTLGKTLGVPSGSENDPRRGRGYVAAGGADAPFKPEPKAGKKEKPEYPYAITDPFADQKAAFLRSEREAYDLTDKYLKELAERAKDTGYAITDPLEDIKSNFLRAEKDGYEATDKLLKDMQDRADKVQTLGQELGLTFSSAFEDAIVSGGNFRDLLKGLEQDILRIVTRKLVTEPLGAAVSSLFSGGGSGGGLGGLAATAGGFIKNLFGGFFADGGFLPPGRWGVAGERGPEPIFGGRTGMTVQAAGGGGGQRNYFNFTLAGPVDRRTLQQVYAAAARGADTASRRND